MAKYTNFTYINNDTLSLMSNLHHNISDKQGRATFSVVGFVPVYDHRIDPQIDSVFNPKFGQRDKDSGIITKFPEHNALDAESPFKTLFGTLDGILSDEDIYLWNNTSDSAKHYNLKRDFVNFGTTNKTYKTVVISMGYREAIGYADATNGDTSVKLGTVEFISNTKDPLKQSIPSGTVTTIANVLWRYMFTTIGSFDPVPGKPNDNFKHSLDVKTLSVTPGHSENNVITYDGKIVTSERSPVIYGLTSAIATEVVPVSSKEIFQGSWDNSTNKNLQTPVVALTGDNDTAVWEAIDIQDYEFVTSQDPIFSKTKQVDYALLTASSGGLGATTNSVQDVFKNIRYFAKSYSQDKTDTEKTVATYRVQFDDEIGTVKFNKIITYIRLYIPNPDNGNWEWSDRLYPLTVTILPEPVIKSNIGQSGVDSFELDIQIDYNQLLQGSTEQLARRGTFFDTPETNKISNWTPIINAVRGESSVTLPTLPEDITNSYVGLQWDKRLFASTDINPTDFPAVGSEQAKKVSKQYGRINSDNKTYIYYDLDLSKVTLLIQDPNAVEGVFITINGKSQLNPISDIAYAILTTKQKEFNIDTNNVVYFTPSHVEDYKKTVSIRDAKIASSRKQYADWVKLDKADYAKMYPEPQTLQFPTAEKTIEYTEIFNQYEIGNHIDFSDNGLLLTKNSTKGVKNTGVYASYFKWFMDNSGAQDSTQNTQWKEPLLDDQGEKVPNKTIPMFNPNLDISYSWKISDTDYLLDSAQDNLPGRLDKVNPDKDYAGYRIGGTAGNRFDNTEIGLFKNRAYAARDFAPSIIPGKDSDGNDTRSGLGRSDSKWEHLFAKRTYANKSYSGEANTSLVTMNDFKDKNNLTLIENYKLNQLLNQGHFLTAVNSTHVADADVKSTSETFYNADETANWNGTSVLKQGKNGELELYTNVTNKTLITVNDENIVDKVFSVLNTSILDSSINAKDKDGNVILPQTLADRSHRTVTVSEISVDGHVQDNATSKFNMASIAFGAGFNKYTNHTNFTDYKQKRAPAFINVHTSHNGNVGEKHTIKGGLNIGFGFELDVANKDKDQTIRDLIKLSESTSYILGTTDYIPNAVAVTNYGVEYFGISVDATNAENIEITPTPYFSTLIAPQGNCYARVKNQSSVQLATLAPADNLIFKVLNGLQPESTWQGRCIGHTAFEDYNLADGAIISNAALRLVLNFPSVYNKSNKNTTRLGSYRTFRTNYEAELNDQNNFWQVYSNEIYNDGDSYQTGSINVKGYVKTNVPESIRTTNVVDVKDILEVHNFDFDNRTIANTSAESRETANTTVLNNSKAATQFAIRNIYDNRRSLNQTPPQLKSPGVSTMFDYFIIRTDDGKIWNADDRIVSYDKVTGKMTPGSVISRSNKDESIYHPMMMGKDLYGSFSTKHIKNDDDYTQQVNEIKELTSDIFDTLFKVSSSSIIIGSDILPRDSYTNTYDVDNQTNCYFNNVVKTKHYHGVINDAMINSYRGSWATPQNSNKNIGANAAPAQFCSSYVRTTNTNALQYNLADDYSKFITRYLPDNFSRTNSLKNHGVPGNLFMSASLYFKNVTKLSNPAGNINTTDFNVDTSIKSSLYDVDFVSEWNNERTSYNSYQTGATLANFVTHLEEKFPYIDLENSGQCDNFNEPRASKFMNLSVTGNLMPTTIGDNPLGDANSDLLSFKTFNTKKVKEYYGGRSLMYFDVYNESLFTLGKAHNAFKEIATNTITSSLLAIDQPRSELISETNSKGQQWYTHQEVLNDGYNPTNYDGFKLDYFRVNHDSHNEDTKTETVTNIQPMNDLVINTGDLIPTENTVMKYFYSNKERFSRSDSRGGTWNYRKTSREWRAGFITPTTASLGSEEQRFADGYFNRLSIKFQGQHSEFTEWHGHKYFRQENQKGEGLAYRDNDETNTDRSLSSTLLSNKNEVTSFGKDTYDSGFLEFVNQPRREERHKNTFSRFVMEPTGGDAFSTEYSGASRDRKIAHSMMWRHNLNIDTDLESTYNGNRKDAAEPFNILPQMEFKTTSSKDTTIRFKNSYFVETGVCTPDLQVYMNPTISLGGWYAGERNPGYDNGNWNSTQETIYHPEYLYEFKDMFSREAHVSDLLTVSSIVGTHIVEEDIDNIYRGVVNFKSHIIPEYDDIIVGSHNHRMREVNANALTSYYDSLNYNNSVLAQGLHKQLTMGNITRNVNAAGGNMDVTNDYTMSFSGTTRVNYVASGSGYGKDAYVDTFSMSWKPWTYTEYNSFHMHWDWEYDANDNPNGSPEDMGYRFHILPKMKDGVKTSVLVNGQPSTEELPYLYPTMDLGGYDESFDTLHVFHTTHQWHTQTGSIGILGRDTKTRSTGKARETGNDQDAITVLDAMAFQGGVSLSYNSKVETRNIFKGYTKPGTNTDPKPIYAEEEVYTSVLEPSWTSHSATPMYIKAEEMQVPMNETYFEQALHQKPSSATPEFSESFKRFKSGIELFTDVVEHMRGLNKFKGRIYNPLIGGGRYTYGAANGRVNQKGLYGVNMLQGEYTESSRSGDWVNSHSRVIMPIYVSGDLLPVMRRESVSTPTWGDNVGIVTDAKTSSKPVGWQNYEVVEKLNSSLGAPGHEWESIWAKTIFADQVLTDNNIYYSEEYAKCMNLSDVHRKTTMTVYVEGSRPEDFNAVNNPIENPMMVAEFEIGGSKYKTRFKLEKVSSDIPHGPVSGPALGGGTGITQ